MGIFPDEVHESLGPWAACDACHELLETGNREGLLARSVTEFFKDPLVASFDPTRVRAQILEAHQGFFSHWYGEGRRIEEPKVN